MQNKVKLSNGVEMPLLGLGVWRAREEEATDAVNFALQNGYSLIDTAAFYENEEQVGEGIRKAGVKREEVFVTTKVWIDQCGYDKTMRSYEASLKRLGLEYVDMFMVHWPVEETYAETWRALERLYDEKMVRAIAVSNFPVSLLKRMENSVNTMPMVNQVQFHPLYFREELYQYCPGKNIVLQAWRPLGSTALAEDAGLQSIAQKYQKTVQQVILRWELQLGLSTIPKSVNPDRILQNIAVFDFALDQDDMAYIRTLNKDESLSQSPDGIIV